MKHEKNPVHLHCLTTLTRHCVYFFSTCTSCHSLLHWAAACLSKQSDKISELLKVQSDEELTPHELHRAPVPASLHLLAILEKILSTYPVDAGMLRMWLMMHSTLGRSAAWKIATHLAATSLDFHWSSASYFSPFKMVFSVVRSSYSWSMLTLWMRSSQNRWR